MALAVEFNSDIKSLAKNTYELELGYDYEHDYTEDEFVYWYLETELEETLQINDIDPEPYKTCYSEWLRLTYNGQFAPGTPEHTEVIEAAKLFLETTPTPTLTP